MADVYVRKGATTLTSADLGGATLASGDSLFFPEPVGIITGASLDQSGLAVGLAVVRIEPGCTAGRIGGGSAGSLLVDADTAAGAYVANLGAVELYITAGGGSTLINNLDQEGTGATYATGGTIANVTVGGGRFEANSSTVITNFVAVGGSGEIEYNATAITAARIHGGRWVIRRAVTTLTVSGNAVVIYDPDDAATISGTTIVTRGGRLIHMAGATPTVVNEGGIYDHSQARIAFTPGATAWTLIGTIYIGSTLVPTTNRTRLYGSQVSPDGPIPL